MVATKTQPVLTQKPQVDSSSTSVPSTVSSEAGPVLKKNVEVNSIGNLDNCGSFWGDYSNNDHCGFGNDGNVQLKLLFNKHLKCFFLCVEQLRITTKI